MTDALTDPDWVLCPGCGEMLYGPRLVRNHKVCADCGHHLPLTAAERIELLFDAGTVDPLDAPVFTGDPLEFVDAKPYPQRVDEARAETGLAEAAVCVRGRIGGRAVVCAVMDFRFMGGSLGCAVGDLITRAAEVALAEATPLLLVVASGGARMQEGTLALMQMAKTSQAIGELDRAGILTISLVTDPTFGGVAASFATLGDVIVAEPGARLGFAGRRVIEQTIGQSLPPDFQTAEFLLGRGLIDMIRPRADLPATLGRLLAVAATPPADQASSIESTVVTDPADLPEPDPWSAVRAARDFSRPSTWDYIAELTEGFEELHGDRLGGGDCPAIVAGLGRLDGLAVAVIGHQKGHTGAELAEHNYGMPTPAGYRKAARVMRLAAKLGLPVVTLVDTPGAYPGAEAEEQGQAVAIAETIRLMVGLPVPTVAVVTGEGGSGGALALAVADVVLICAGAVYSVISPEGCAAILWRDPQAAPTAAAALRVDARQLLELGIVDAVIPEPDGGAQLDPTPHTGRVGATVSRTLRSLLADRANLRAAHRHRRFRRFGAAPKGRAAGEIRPGDDERGSRTDRMVGTHEH